MSFTGVLSFEMRWEGKKFISRSRKKKLRSNSYLEALLFQMSGYYSLTTLASMTLTKPYPRKTYHSLLGCIPTPGLLLKTY